MANRANGQVAWIFGYFEVGENRGREMTELAVPAQRPFGFACRAAGIIERRDRVAIGKVAWGVAPTASLALIRSLP
jgi:hypothetical protein